MCGCLSRTPPTGDLACNPSMCPDWESNRQPFGSQARAQSSEPHQPGWYFQLKGQFQPISHLLNTLLFCLGTWVSSISDHFKSWCVCVHFIFQEAKQTTEWLSFKRFPQKYLVFSCQWGVTTAIYLDNSFHVAKLTLCPTKQQLLIPPSSQALASRHLLSVSMNLTSYFKYLIYMELYIDSFCLLFHSA